MKELLYTWEVGRSRHTHKGFAVYKIIGRTNKPEKNMVGRIYESAEQAVHAAEGHGPGYSVFRVYNCNSGIEPHELIQRKDLPVIVTLNPQQRY